MSNKRVFIENDNDDPELSDTDSFNDRRRVRNSRFYPATVPNEDAERQPGIAWVIKKLFEPVVGNPVYESTQRSFDLFERWKLYRQAPTAEIKRELARELGIVRLQIDQYHTTIPIALLDDAAKGVNDVYNRGEFFKWANHHKRIIPTFNGVFRGMFKIKDGVIAPDPNYPNRPWYLVVFIDRDESVSAYIN